MSKKKFRMTQWEADAVLAGIERATKKLRGDFVHKPWEPCPVCPALEDHGIVRDDGAADCNRCPITRHAKYCNIHENRYYGLTLRGQIRKGYQMLRDAGYEVK